MGRGKLIPYEAYPLVVFIAGIVTYAGFRCFKLATNPYVRFRRDDQEVINENVKNQAENPI
jgi:hypothetical protein